MIHEASFSRQCTSGPAGPMEQTTIGEFLVRRLKEVGCDHIFGVPGDFVLGFLNQILKSDIQYVGTCNELNAAYAADGYARLRGVGCLVTTYTVGELSAINGVAGSYAESVPVIKITGLPPLDYCRGRLLLHHSLTDYNSPLKMYSHITVAQTVLKKQETAMAEIDRVLTACLRKKLPVYIGIPTDMVLTTIDAPVATFRFPKAPKSDPGALKEAILETLRSLHQSRRPIFIPGVEVDRHRLQKAFEGLLAASGVPFTTMMLSKATLDEDHPQFIGLYCGDRSHPSVQERVESSDCLIIFGEKLTDFNTGGFSASMDRRSTIEVMYNCVRIMFHSYTNVYIHDFIRELTIRIAYHVPKNLDVTPSLDSFAHRPTGTFKVEPSHALTMSRFFDRMANFIRPNSVVLAEAGASLFSAVEMCLPTNTKFIGQTFYGSIGFTIGATLGVSLAAPDRPVVLFVGDGAFQVACQDLSTMIRYNCKPTIFLINNDGYTVERVIVDRIYNDIQAWKYHKLCDVFGGGKSYDARTEGELEAAVQRASENRITLNLIEIHLGRFDCNEALRRLGAAIAASNCLLEEEPVEEKEKQGGQQLSHQKLFFINLDASPSATPCSRLSAEVVPLLSNRKVPLVEKPSARRIVQPPTLAEKSYVMDTAKHHPPSCVVVESHSSLVGEQH